MYMVYTNVWTFRHSKKEFYMKHDADCKKNKQTKKKTKICIGIKCNISKQLHITN